MKPNEPQKWIVTLYGATGWHGANDRPGHAKIEITGDIEAALQAADELESEVDFEVHRFVISRAAICDADQISALTEALRCVRNRLNDCAPNEKNAEAIEQADRALCLANIRRSDTSGGQS